jgi:alkanesulfonate monooxygenase SsuD/methylene tetrahydromethanopterin reductase-like flavin-dependent oxidoreductase (luciferase family)
MSLVSALRINMTGLCSDPSAESERYRAALDMAVYAEEQGFDVVALEEHHCAENGWLPAPLTLAAMIIARTKRVRVHVAALLVTLYDPVRLAEEIAILDLVSQGRFSFVAGLGYRPVEYHAMGKSWKERGRLMDESLETLLAAWSGEPFTYRGETIRVTPTPMSRPHRFFFVGGLCASAGRRAARFGLPFFPPMPRPDLEAVYRAELEKHGKQGLYQDPGPSNAMTVADPDPESAWLELAPYFLRELQEYSTWKQEGVLRPGEEEVHDIAGLRAQGRFAIATPGDLLRQIAAAGPHTAVVHPLAGGIPVPRAWQILRLYAEEVHGPIKRAAASS